MLFLYWVVERKFLIAVRREEIDSRCLYDSEIIHAKGLMIRLRIMKQAQLVNMKTTKTVKAPKMASKRVSAGMMIKKVAEITWIKDDNCCLLFAIREMEDINNCYVFSIFRV